MQAGKLARVTQCRGNISPVPRYGDEGDEHVRVRRMSPVRAFQQSHRLGGRAGGVQRDRVDVGVACIVRSQLGGLPQLVSASA